MINRRVSKQGKQLFKEWEGLECNVYLDSAGYPTIGIGHLLTRAELSSGKIIIGDQVVGYSDGLTEDQCWELLGQDLWIAENAVNQYVDVPLTQNQFDSLVSFVFNVGVGAFRDSTLLRFLNNLQYDAVPEQLKRWNKSGGKVVQGLVNRREKEINLWRS
jgi:lysozyme